MSQFNSKLNDGDEGESQPTTFQFSKGSAPFASSANDTPASAYDNSDLQDYTNAEQVAHALHVLLNTKTWNETRGILEREHALLLSTTAQQILNLLIRQAQQGNNLEQRQQAGYLLLHLALLKDSRLYGIPATWSEFETTLQRIEQYSKNSSEEQGITFTREEAEQATQDATFLADKLNLAVDDPGIPALQAYLRSMVADAARSEKRGQRELSASPVSGETELSPPTNSGSGDFSQQDDNVDLLLGVALK